jgi:hypothetical protein
VPTPARQWAAPRTRRPPVVVKSTPAPNALGYKKDEFSVQFDELILLKDVSQKLVVSPPMNNQPTAVAHGNELVVSFKDTLQDNTTYTFDFADAITDNNEGNILPNFRFSFSTGQVVDSMQISGQLFQAGDLSPVSGALVFLHNNLSDTAFQKLVPVRLAKTSETGRFTIANVSPGKYRVFALEDANRNYKYDQPGERIAWLDTLVVPDFTYRTVTDSVAPDSTVSRQVLCYTPDSLQLFMFGEDQPIQYVTSDKRAEAAKISLTFKRSADKFGVQLTDEPLRKDWYMIERNKGNDSLSIWLKEPELYSKDTLQLLVSYAAVDSMMQPIVKTDSIAFYYFKPEAKKKKKNEEEAQAPVLAISDLRSTIAHYSPLSFSVQSAPIAVVDSGFHLFSVVDSVKTEIPFGIEHDTVYIRRFRVTNKWEPGGSYEFDIDSASVRDIYGITNNALSHKFSIKPLDSYGTAYVTIQNPKPNWLLQIVDTKNNPIRQAVVPANGKLAFRFIPPGELLFRIVDDKNANGQWDTGVLAKWQQPETVFYYPEKVVIRANWDHEVKWDPATFDIYKHAEKFVKSKGGDNQSPKGKR